MSERDESRAQSAAAAAVVENRSDRSPRTGRTPLGRAAVAAAVAAVAIVVFAVCFGLPDPVHRYSYGRLKAAADQINQAAESTCSPHDGSSDGPASVDVLRGRIHLERRIGVALVSLEDRPLLEDGTMLASDACNRG